MEFLTDLWLPILLSGVGVFVVSSVLHMGLQYHKNDYVQIPNETAVLAALRSNGVKPGQYMFPRPASGSMKECSSPEMLAKFKQGPVGSMIVLPDGMPSIGKSLLQWFLLSLAVGVFAAYVAGHSLSHGAPFAQVMRITGAVAFAGYALGNVTDSIWKGVSWSTTTKFLFDGLLYALTTGAIFAWKWPPLVG